MNLRTSKWIQYCFGYCTVEIRGSFAERFISENNLRGVELWHIRRKEPYILEARVAMWDYPKLEPFAKRTQTELLKISEHGFPLILRKYRFRWGIPAGAILFCAILGIMSTFLWSVEVSGNETVRSYDILQFLKQHGFREGTQAASHDLPRLKFLLMNEFDTLSFATIHIYGSKAVVEVEESTPIPEMVPQEIPCNLIASNHAQILSVEVYEGKSYVRAGDSVQAGQLLVSGVLDSARIGYRLVHAAAKIEARVLRVLTETVPLTKTVRIPTGKTKTVYELQLFGLTVPLTWNSRSPYSVYEVQYKQTDLSFRDFIFPIALKTVTYTEVTEEIRVQKEEDAVRFAKQMLDEAERIALHGAEIEKKETEIQVSEQSVTCTYLYTCIEEITVTQEIYQEKKGS